MLPDAKASPKTKRVARKKHAAKRTAMRVGEGPRQSGADLLLYNRGEGVRVFSLKVGKATPIQMMEIERRGVQGILVKDLAKELDLPAARFFKMLGVPKATAEQKAASGQVIAGAGGHAALGMVKLLSIAQGIVANSTSADAKGFDTAKWLGQWIERPQASLGGKKPSEFLDTPTGITVVARLLGAAESGSYL